MVIIQILKQLKQNQEIIKTLRKENRKQEKLLNKLVDSLVHKEELLRVFQKYTKKNVQKYGITQNNLEEGLKEICSSCPCLLRSIKSFAKNSQKGEKLEEKNWETNKIKKN